MPERIFAVSIMGFIRCYITTFFTFIFAVFLLNLFLQMHVNDKLIYGVAKTNRSIGADSMGAIRAIALLVKNQ